MIENAISIPTTNSQFVVGMLLVMSCSIGKHQPEASIIADSVSLENKCIVCTNILLLNFNDPS